MRSAPTLRGFAVLSCGAISTAGSAGSAVAPEALTVPSGQPISFLEKRVEPEEALVRFRFIAPDLASPLTRPSFEAISADLEVLCSEFALIELAKSGDDAAQIIVSLSAEEIEFGVSNAEVEQVFEAFRVENGICMLEMF